MVDVKELRIGNIVTCYGGGAWTIIKIVNIAVHSIGGHSNGYVSTHERVGMRQEHLNAVPLTEELLLKCGFTEMQDSDYYYGMPVFCKNGVHIVCKTFDKESFCFGVLLIDVTSLHQLQNIYYTLTGEELDITDAFIQ